ncbi:hypothetical protein BDQ17DRAFT_1411379 [Cyathus striatus]|nr:hypothetical protein BDQ17DRAFT_1411379 [Cyathus striatus]
MDSYANMSMPTNVIKLIIDEVALTNDSDSLNACALTCRLFLEYGRRHQFHAITFREYTCEPSASRLSGLYDILEVSPHIAPYIRQLIIFENDLAVFACSAFPQVLKKLQNLESCKLRFNPFVDWEAVPSGAADALVNQFFSPRMERLELSGIYNIPALVTRSFLHLTFLRLIAVDFSTADGNIKHTVQRTDNPTLKSLLLFGLSISTLRPLLDWLSHHDCKSLEELNFWSIFTEKDHRKDAVFIGAEIMEKQRNNITKLDMTSYFLNEEELSKVDIGILSHLRVLGLCISFEDTYDPLGSALKILSKARIGNAIEEVETKIIYYPGSEYRPRLSERRSEWERFDTLLSSSDRFPNLRSVVFVMDLDIYITTEEDEDDVNEGRSLLKSLVPKTQRRGILQMHSGIERLKESGDWFEFEARKVGPLP